MHLFFQIVSKMWCFVERIGTFLPIQAAFFSTMFSDFHGFSCISWTNFHGFSTDFGPIFCSWFSHGISKNAPIFFYAPKNDGKQKNMAAKVSRRASFQFGSLMLIRPSRRPGLCLASCVLGGKSSQHSQVGWRFQYHFGGKTTQDFLRLPFWVVATLFHVFWKLFTPKIGEDEPNLTSIFFQRGLVQPATRWKQPSFWDLLGLVWEFCLVVVFWDRFLFGLFATESRRFGSPQIVRELPQNARKLCPDVWARLPTLLQGLTNIAPENVWLNVERVYTFLLGR